MASAWFLIHVPLETCSSYTQSHVTVCVALAVTTLEDILVPALDWHDFCPSNPFSVTWTLCVSVSLSGKYNHWLISTCHEISVWHFPDSSLVFGICWHHYHLWDGILGINRIWSGPNAASSWGKRAPYVPEFLPCCAAWAKCFHLSCLRFFKTLMACTQEVWESWELNSRISCILDPLPTLGITRTFTISFHLHELPQRVIRHGGLA